MEDVRRLLRTANLRRRRNRIPRKRRPSIRHPIWRQLHILQRGRRVVNAVVEIRILLPLLLEEFESTELLGHLLGEVVHVVEKALLHIERARLDVLVEEVGSGVESGLRGVIQVGELYGREDIDVADEPGGRLRRIGYPRKALVPLLRDPGRTRGVHEQLRRIVACQ